MLYMSMYFSCANYLVEALIIWVLKCFETSQENKTFFFHFRWQRLPTETNAFYSYPENKVGKKYLQTSICIMPIWLSPLSPKLSPKRFAYQTGLVVDVIAGGGGHFLVTGWGRAAGWDLISFSPLDWLKWCYNFIKVTRMGSHIFRDLGGSEN